MAITTPHSKTRKRRVQHPIQVMVPTELESALTEEARQAGLSRSAIVRQACEEHVLRLKAQRDAAERRRLLLAAYGCLAGVGGSSAEFAAAREEETRREDSDAVRP